MGSDWKRDDAPAEGEPASTMLAAPRAAAGPAQRFNFGSLAMPVPEGAAPPAPPAAPAFAAGAAAPEAGGTMIGLGRVPMPPGAGYTPRPAAALDAGGTMVGLGRVVPPGTFAAPAPAAVEAGGTMIGLGRVPVPGGAFAAPGSAFPAPGGAYAAPPASQDGGGTMIGLGRVMPPSGSAFAPPSPAFAGSAATDSGEAGGTMVGLGRVAVPPGGGFGAPDSAPVAPEAGGTMVGLGRVLMPSGAFGPAAPAAPDFPEAGGTMVGLPRAAHPAGAFGLAPPADDIAGDTFPGARTAAPAPARPAGPPPDYDIVAHLGGGELGQVFHGRHKANGAEAALRIVPPHIASVPGALDALRDVAALAQNAQHPHLGAVYHLDETASPALVVEYVPGRLLTTLMAERGAAPPAAVVDLGTRLCSALAAAHAAGLAHGRVHAGNVILEAKTGRWVLVDMAVGYCVQPLEPAHDLYALGALLYELACGRPPFENGAQTAPDPRTHKAGVPAALAAVLLRTLSPDPAHWYPSAVELAQALSRCRGQP